MQTLGHLNSCSQSIDAWMEKPLSTGCENTLLNTDFTSVTVADLGFSKGGFQCALD